MKSVGEAIAWNVVFKRDTQRIVRELGVAPALPDRGDWIGIDGKSKGKKTA